MVLYVYRGQLGMGSPGCPPPLSHSSWALTLKVQVLYCVTSTEPVPYGLLPYGLLYGLLGRREHRTSTSTFTQLLSSESNSSFTQRLSEYPPKRLQRCLVVTWLVRREIAAVWAQVLCRLQPRTSLHCH